jgi:YVTN family beta-propeller protein
MLVTSDSLWAAHPASQSVIGLSLPDGKQMWQTELECEPTTLTRLDSHLFVTCFDTGELVVLGAGSGKVLKSRWVGYGAFGVIESAGRLYISLAHERSILVLDAGTLEEITRAPTGDQPRGLALKANQLYVVHLMDASVRVFDAATLGVLGSISIGLQSAFAESVTLDPNKARAYVPHQRQHITNMARLFDSTVFPKVSVLDTDQQRPIRREALALDSIDMPVGIPIAVVLSEDGVRLYVANAASDDISVIDLSQGMGVGHVPVGHHPRDLALSADDEKLYILNMVSDDVSVIDTATLSVVETFTLTEDPRPSIIQRGERIFRTSRPDEIARDNWIACASCHLDGGSDGQTWLGTEGGARNTSILRGISGTEPLHWSADRPDVQSFQETFIGLMGGTGLSQPELDALATYLNSLQPFASPLREPDGSLPEAAIQGAAVFQQAGCTVCHTAPQFTDRQMHDVGTGEPFRDHPSGKGQKVAETLGTSFDTPSLRELWLTAPYLHDGRAKTLRDVLVAFNNNDRHGTTSDLSQAELFALEAFLLALPLAQEESARLLGK